MSTPIDQLMRQADPVDLFDLPPITGTDDDELYAAILEKTLQPTQVAWQPARRRVGPLLAAAVFAAVLLIVGVIALLTTTGAEPDVVDEPTPTFAPETTVAPPTTVVPEEEAAATTSAATTTTEPEEEGPLPDYALSPPFELQPIASVLDSVHTSLSIDAEGRLYLGDWDFSNRIYRVALDGSVEVWAEDERLRWAHSSAFGPDGRLYVTSNDNGLLFAFSEDGTAEVVSDQLSEPTGILFLPDGRLLVADAGPNVIYEVLADGTLQEFARHRFFIEPQNMALDDERNIYVTNFANGRLQRISPTGEIEELHQFNDAIVDVLYQDGVLYIAGRGALGRVNGLVYRYVLEDGTVEMVAGADGEALELFAPVSLEAGSGGEIYLTYETPTSVGVLTPAG